MNKSVHSGILFGILYSYGIPYSKADGANMGPTRGAVVPRWAPCRPHEPCYLGSFLSLSAVPVSSLVISWLSPVITSLQTSMTALATRGSERFQGATCVAPPAIKSTGEHLLKRSVSCALLGLHNLTRQLHQNHNYERQYGMSMVKCKKV